MIPGSIPNAAIFFPEYYLHDFIVWNAVGKLYGKRWTIQSEPFVPGIKMYTSECDLIRKSVPSTTLNYIRWKAQSEQIVSKIYEKFWIRSQTNLTKILRKFWENSEKILRRFWENSHQTQNSFSLSMRSFFLLLRFQLFVTERPIRQFQLWQPLHPLIYNDIVQLLKIAHFEDFFCLSALVRYRHAHHLECFSEMFVGHR